MDWNQIPRQPTIEKTMASLRERNFNPQLVLNRDVALEKLKEIIPAGSEVMTAALPPWKKLALSSF